MNILIKPFARVIFRRVTKCLVPSEKISVLAEKIIPKDKIIIIGDTRFDQIINRYEKNKNTYREVSNADFLAFFNIDLITAHIAIVIPNIIKMGNIIP